MMVEEVKVVVQVTLVELMVVVQYNTQFVQTICCYLQKSGDCP